MEGRDRVVDLLRVAAIAVVVVWHWSLSVVHRSPDGALANPNPLADLPWLWPATWLLQVVPLFFVAGGYANLAVWRRGPGFYRTRYRRLLLPLAVFVAVWAVVDLAWLVADPARPRVLGWALIVFTPLWFVAAYAWVVAVAPLTARWHARSPWVAAGALGGAVAACDVGRFLLGVEALGWVNSALVWVFAHQLGYLLRDGLLDVGFAVRLGLCAGALAVLVLATRREVYPVSLVAHRDSAISHMLPTTAVVGVAVVFQLSVVLLARPWLERLLHVRAVWAVVRRANSVVFTVYLWHMTALVLAVWAVEALGFALAAEPDGAWWAARPLWVLLPALALAPLVAVFGRVERATRR